MNVEPPKEKNISLDRKRLQHGGFYTMAERESNIFELIKSSVKAIQSNLKKTWR